MMPCSSSVVSRSARMLEEMPSSDLVNSSRKCRRLPNIMSRMTRRLHLLPITSSVRLIAQPERSLIPSSVPRVRCGTKALRRSGAKTACNIAPVIPSCNQLRKLIMWNLMTLDGFVEGENRDISWHFDVWGQELERLSIDQLKSAGGLLFGRVTYELMASHWPSATGEVADFMNALPKYVFSRTLTKSDWNNTQMFGADVRGTIERLKRESGKDILLFGSADLAADLMPHRLIDEFRIAVNPIILGGGTPLFKSGERVKLKLLDAKPLSTGIAILRYEPAK